MSGRFDIEDTPLVGLLVLHKKRMQDHRGFFERVYCSQDLAGVLAGRSIAQVNRSMTAKPGSVRGMHFQRPPYAELKIVSCIKGSIFDVAVDLRRGSPTYLQWHAQVLSDDNGAVLVIPEGFAHGFQTLQPDCEMLYFHTAPYAPDYEAGLNVNDPALAIAWPAAIGEMSERDAAFPTVAQGFEGLVF